MIRAVLAGALLGAAAAPADAQTLGASDAVVDQALQRPADARLVWSDEFDEPTLDHSKWRFDTSRNREGWFNDEEQYYAADRAENARVEDGALVIEARAEKLKSAADYGGQAYTSARIDTKGKAKWTYGFFEVRAKLACGRGLWPAIWMLGSDASRPWPALGEIDIMEMVGWDPNVVHGTIHTEAYNHVKGTQRGAQVTLADVCGTWHRYQLDWSPERLLIGVDDRAYMRFDNDGAGNSATWPFAKPQYLILNVAVGGGWGGQKGIDPAALPSRMAVDYVRVWQRP